MRGTFTLLAVWLKKTAALLLLALVLPFYSPAQISTRGTDFWIGYMTHSNGINPPPGPDAPPPCEMQVYITSQQ
ncbi:MAG TPA: hypothetical protein VD772_11990, partial [Anseongella sp.]|nr:hypothetical protein [Anseongella sp.]